MTQLQWSLSGHQNVQIIVNRTRISAIHRIIRVCNLQLVQYTLKNFPFPPSSFYPVNLKSSENHQSTTLITTRAVRWIMTGRCSRHISSVIRISAPGGGRGEERKERRSRIQMLLHASTSDLPRERPMGFLCRPSSPLSDRFSCGCGVSRRKIR